MALSLLPSTMQHLPCAVKEKYCSALSGGYLVFSQTHLAIIHTNGVPFQLRYCPALSKKPRGSSSIAQPTSKPNPFLNPSKDLLVAQIPRGTPSHNIVINKFPVIPHHFILTTIDFKPQTSLLEEQDLGATYSCLSEWEAGTGVDTNSRRPRLFAFFNSGEHSGASQPHRHIQFLPVEDMAAGQESDGWTLLVDDIFPRPGMSNHGEFHYIPTDTLRSY
jgi:ATP adenylyltransferase